MSPCLGNTVPPCIARCLPWENPSWGHSPLSLLLFMHKPDELRLQ